VTKCTQRVFIPLEGKNGGGYYPKRLPRRLRLLADSADFDDGVIMSLREERSPTK
jgi:hypothetical protein